MTETSIKPINDKPTQLAVLLINNNNGNGIRPNEKRGKLGKLWSNKFRHATLHFKKSQKKMEPLLINNVKGKNPRLVVEGIHSNNFNYSAESIDRLILELSTRIRQFNVYNPKKKGTKIAENHETYLSDLIMRAKIMLPRANGWRKQVLHDILKWIESEQGNIFREGR